jgi:hypothetical protein
MISLKKQKLTAEIEFLLKELEKPQHERVIIRIQKRIQRLQEMRNGRC